MKECQYAQETTVGFRATKKTNQVGPDVQFLCYFHVRRIGQDSRYPYQIDMVGMAMRTIMYMECLNLFRVVMLVSRCAEIGSFPGSVALFHYGPIMLP